MSFPKQVWDQLKNLTCDDIVRALEKDGWVLDMKSGARRVYRHPDRRRVAIDYHPQKTYGPNLLRALLEDTRWTVEDMRRLKLVKK